MSTDSPPALRQAPGYDYAVGYVRVWVILLVVLHHAGIAYLPVKPNLRPLADPPPVWAVFPVIDDASSMLPLLLTRLDRPSLMWLMFLLSGLFVWQGIERRGAAKFLRDRALRLLVPFVAWITLISPLSYAPAYLQRTSSPSLGDFLSQWASVPHPQPGVVWFLYVLFLFDVAAAAIFAGARAWTERFGETLQRLTAKPLRLYIAFTAAGLLLFVPLSLLYGQDFRISLGIVNRRLPWLALYFLYFLLGVAIGAGKGSSIFTGGLSRRWYGWGALALFGFAAFLVTSNNAGVLLTFVFSGAATNFAYIAFFKRFADRKLPVWESWRLNALGIYLLHYPFTNWAQLALVGWPGRPLVKWALVFVVGLVGSWAATAALRRVPGVGRFL